MSFRQVWRLFSLAIRAFVWCAVWAMSPTSVLASSLQVTPTLLKFGSGDQAQALWLRNSGSDPVFAQVRVLSWTQDGGKEQLQPAADLVASPPIVRILPGSEQLVRVILIPSHVDSREHAYRIVIDELPYSPSGASAPKTEGLRLLLRYSIPVFVDSTKQADPDPVQSPARGQTTDIRTMKFAITAYRQHPLSLRLQVTNVSDHWLRLSELGYVDSSGARHVVVGGLLGYVLARQSMSWQLSPPDDIAVSSGGYWEARINEDVSFQRLPLSGVTQ